MPNQTHDAVNHYFSGQGVMMVGLRDDVTGEPIGLRPVGNVPDAKITIATTVLDHKGSQDGQRATDHRLQTEIKLTLSITIENWIAENIAKATRGGATSVAAGTVVGATYEGFAGMVTAFQHIRVSAVTVSAGGLLTRFVDADTPWDYRLNEEAGSIMLNDGISPNAAVDNLIIPSPTTDPITLTVGYAYEEQFLVDALTEPIVDNWVRFEGLNTAEENDPVVIDVFRFQNDPLKELAMLSDTYGQFMLEGSILKDDTRQSGSKYFIIKKVAE